jgi:hypothetical protein
MLWHELSDTLLAYIDGATLQSRPGICVTELQVEMPLEISGAERAGQLVFRAIPPHTRWRSGVLPAVHRASMRVVLDESGGDG